MSNVNDKASLRRCFKNGRYPFADVEIETERDTENSDVITKITYEASIPPHIRREHIKARLEKEFINIYIKNETGDDPEYILAYQALLMPKYVDLENINISHAEGRLVVELPLNENAIGDQKKECFSGRNPHAIFTATPGLDKA